MHICIYEHTVNILSYESRISHGTLFQGTFQFEDYKTLHFAGWAFVSRRLSKYKVANTKFRNENVLAESTYKMPSCDLRRQGAFLNAQLSNYQVAKIKFRTEAFPRGASAKFKAMKFEILTVSRNRP